MYELKQMAQKMLWKSKKQRLESGKMQNHRQNPPKLPKKSPEQTTHHKNIRNIESAKKPQEVKKSKQNTGKRKSEGKRLSNRPSKHSVGTKRTFKNVKHLLSPSTDTTRTLFCPFWSIMKDKFFKNRLKNRRRRSSETKTSQKGEGLSEILPQMQASRFWNYTLNMRVWWRYMTESNPIANDWRNNANFLLQTDCFTWNIFRQKTRKNAQFYGKATMKLHI